MTAKEDRITLSILAVATAIVAFGVAVAALWLNSDGESGASSTGGSEASGGGGAATISVNLAEFSISPNPIEVPAGQAASLSVNNAGSVVHNLQVTELGKGTPDLQAGEKATLDLGALEVGDYTVICTIAGHQAAGMEGTLSVVEGATGGTTDGSASVQQPVSWEEMDKQMEEVAAQFPAETLGDEGGIMEPTMVDGVKEYVLTSKVVDWEVEPGKMVKAWTYNGFVPGPEIHVEVGDTVRIILKNELPESTSLHLHGVRVPNRLDGVDPFTQPAIPPGGEFVYEFEALEPAVGMYHSHHDAQVQIPNGMAGALYIETPGADGVMRSVHVPDSLNTPDLNVVKEITMVLNDAGTIGLSLNGKSFPATTPYTLRQGESMIVHYYNEGLTGHPMHLHQPSGWAIGHDGIQLPAPFPADTIWVAPGERWTMLYTAKDLGVWAWHCHILTHAETPTGMRYMVTALIVEE
jgi:FtsP/CotA-like multicopper oxidase with cupredoxin domain